MSALHTRISRDRVAAAERAAVGPNLYRDWMSDQNATRWLGKQKCLTSDEVCFLQRWAERRGWRIRLHAGADSQAQIVEVFGPDPGEGDVDGPIGLIYVVGNAFQVDEWTGKSWRWPSLEDALTFVSDRL